MREAGSPPFGEKNWAVILLRVKLAIRQSGSLQVECVCKGGCTCRKGVGKAENMERSGF